MIRLLGIFIVFALGLSVVIWAAAGAYARASERTVTYQYISDALDALNERPNNITWEPATEELVRPFTPGDAQLIGTAMTQAWYNLTVAQDTQETAILRDGFSGVAQERAIQSVADARRGGRMLVLGQTARPAFYHLDGSVFQAQTEMLTVRYLLEEGDLRSFEIVNDTAVTTMMNESNGWRVYAHERVGTAPVEAEKTPWVGPPLAGFNYYPAQTPWSAFWPSFDAEVIRKDFDRIRGFGANAVRVFLTTETFTNPDTQAAATADLARLLVLAEAAGLWVVPTLFDLKPGYDPAGWRLDRAYLNAVLPVLQGSRAVAYIDIKNEPDLDFASHGRGTVHAWLMTMAALVRHDAHGLPLTIGWSNAQVATQLSETVDLVTYHDYAPIKDAADSLAVLQATTDLPVMVTEIGVSSYTLALGMPGSDAAQRDDLAARLAALAAADGIFVWTLHDFPEVEAAAVGGSPWVKRIQSHFGLVSKDGIEKPAAEALREGFQRITGNR